MNTIVRVYEVSAESVLLHETEAQIVIERFSGEESAHCILTDEQAASPTGIRDMVAVMDGTQDLEFTDGAVDSYDPEVDRVIVVAVLSEMNQDVTVYYGNMGPTAERYFGIERDWEGRFVQTGI